VMQAVNVVDIATGAINWDWKRIQTCMESASFQENLGDYICYLHNVIIAMSHTQRKPNKGPSFMA
jgi:hypothetical protein